MTPTEQAMAWLEARGLDPEVCAKMGLDGATGRDGAVLLRIPYIRDGRVVTKQYRRLDKKEYRFASGGEVDLWNVDILKDTSLFNQPVMIAEGVLDALSLIQAGYIRTVAVPGWSDKNFAPDNYEPFKRNEALLKQAPRIIVAQDHDPTGQAMVRAIANFLDENEVCYVTWPEGCKDANDVLKEWGSEYIVAAINGVKQIDPPGVQITGISDHPPQPPRAVWDLGEGFEAINKRVCFRSRELSVLTGIPGSGKTTFATWLAHHLARVHDVRIGMALFESDYREVTHHLLVLNGHVAPDLDGRLEGNENDAVRATVKRLDRNFRILHKVDTDDLHGMDWLRKTVKVAATRDGCRIIFVDPWNEIDHLPEPTESLTNYINFALTKMRQWAERYDIHICLVVHPRKINDRKAPDGYDCADSAAFFNKPGLGLTIHLDQDQAGEYVLLKNWKVRNRQQMKCRPGSTQLIFDEHAMTYRPRPKS